MRKLLLAPLLFAGLASCSKSGGSDPAPVTPVSEEELLLGTWQEVTFTESAGGHITTQAVAPGHVTKTYATNGVYTLVVDGKASGPGTYTYKDKVLLITSDNKTTAWTVSELTSTKMVKFTGPAPGVVDTYTYAR